MKRDRQGVFTEIFFVFMISLRDAKYNHSIESILCLLNRPIQWPDSKNAVSMLCKEPRGKYV